MSLHQVRLGHAGKPLRFLNYSLVLTVVRYNSSATIVHNVCANILLERAVQISQSKPPSVIHDVMGEELPLPPLPGQIDVIVAGCPW